MNSTKFGSLFLIFGIFSCHSAENGFDASGVFESIEIIVSAETNGVISAFSYDEGDQIDAGLKIVEIEATDLALQKDQLEATIESLAQKKNESQPQVDVLEKQLKAAISSVSALNTQLQVLINEQDRIHTLFQSKAATDLQKDEIDGKVSVLEKQIISAENNVDVISAQISSAKRQVDIQNRGIFSEKKPLEKQMEQVQYRINKSIVINPVSGTILTKYAYQGEFVNVGKPLYKIADLREMELKAFIDGDQLSRVILGQKVKVYIDKDNESFYEYDGVVTWISDKAEFTPKTIQMKDERANLVYAIKVKVPNDGKIKIGMYGEISFTNDESH